jgi:hypothetical protein
MGLGKFVKMSLSDVVECDWCGGIIVDGRFRPTGSASADRHGGRGLGFFETLIFSSKKHNFCSKACQMKYEQAHLVKDKLQVVDDSMKLADENMKLANEYMKLEIEKSKSPGINTGIRPNVNGTNKFCSNCGSVLKQNAHFCTKCGNKTN